MPVHMREDLSKHPKIHNRTLSTTLALVIKDPSTITAQKIRYIEAHRRSLWLGEERLTPSTYQTLGLVSTSKIKDRPLPPTVWMVVAEWLNKLRPRPARIIANLAQTSTENYRDITPILYSTIVLGGDHSHHCLQLPHASDVIRSIGTARMADGAKSDGSYLKTDDWSNTIRKLNNLSQVKTIHLDGPLPDQLSQAILSDLQLNVFENAKCVVFDRHVIDAIGSTRTATLVTFTAPVWAPSSPFIDQINRIRPLWLSALITITRPERLHTNYRPIVYTKWRKLDHRGDCNCGRFAGIMKNLGHNHQWDSLKEFHAHGLIDHCLPVILTCNNILNFSSHLRRQAKSASTKHEPGSNLATTSTMSSASTSHSGVKLLIEVDTNSNQDVVYPGPSWSERIMSLASFTVNARLSLLKVPGYTAYPGRMPRRFAFQAWNIAGHVESSSVPTNRSDDVLKRFYARASNGNNESLTMAQGIAWTSTSDPRTSKIPVKIRYEKLDEICECGQDHSSRLPW